MKIINNAIKLEELRNMAEKMFGNFVKAVVDVEREIIAVDAELHADEEACLIESGSKQKDLWGINLYPELKGNEFIEFDSMINLKPAQDNLTRGVENRQTQEKIRQIVNKLIKNEPR